MFRVQQLSVSSPLQRRLATTCVASLVHHHYYSAASQCVLVQLQLLFQSPESCVLGNMLEQGVCTESTKQVGCLSVDANAMVGLAPADLGATCDTEYVRRYPPGGADLDRAFRNLVARDIYWHPPLVKLDRENLRARCATFAQRMQHPRAAIISASTSVRLMYTCQIWDATSGCHGLRLPPCEWCGMPTGYFCSGIAPTDQRHCFDCRVAVCTICSKFLDLCVNCTIWSGIPSEVDKRIVYSDISVRPYEKPGPVVTAMLQGMSISDHRLPLSWLEIRGQQG